MRSSVEKNKGNRCSNEYNILDYISDFFITIWNVFTTPFQSMLSIEANA